MPGIKNESVSPEPHHGSSARFSEAERYLEEQPYVKQEEDDNRNVYVNAPAPANVFERFELEQEASRKRRLYNPDNNPQDFRHYLDRSTGKIWHWHKQTQTWFKPNIHRTDPAYYPLPPPPPPGDFVDFRYSDRPTTDLIRDRDPGSRPSTFDDDHRSSRDNHRSRRDRDEPPRHRRDVSNERRRSGRDTDYNEDRRGSRHGNSDRRRTRSPDIKREPRDRSPEIKREPRDDGDGGRHYSSRDRDYEYSRRRDGSADRYYRPGRDSRDSRRRDDRDDRGRHGDDRRYRERDDRTDYDRPRQRRRTPSPRGKPRSPSPNEDEKDRRTVFVQQLAQRVRTKDLKEFFEKAGPVATGSIVKDRISQRSKGVGYVEFKNEESVKAAIALTGQKLCGIPVIVQLTEAEKNRQARQNENAGNGNANGVPFHRLYVGNIHFSVNEQELATVFEPFGELGQIELQKDENGRSRGYGFVQFIDYNDAKEALEKMNGFELAGRPIRVGLGNDRFTKDSTEALMKNFGQQSKQFQGSQFSGAGGRGAHAGGGGGNFDRAGGRDDSKGAGGASALDDTDVSGVNFNNFNRYSLMSKLARTDEDSNTKNGDSKKASSAMAPPKKPLPVAVPDASRHVRISNAFDAQDEYRDNGPDWAKSLADEFREGLEDQYGHVIHIAVDENSHGDIYAKFDRVQGGENAIKGLNGRLFNGRTLTAQFVVDHIYNTMWQLKPKAL